MKKLVLILMLLTPVWAFTQTQTFSDREVQEMDSLFQVYEQNDSIQKLKISLLLSPLAPLSIYLGYYLHQKFNEESFYFII